MALDRYHVMIDQIRTTVTLAPVVSELLALKLGAQPQTPAAHAALRAWLQQEIDRDPGAVRHGRASQRLAQQAILTIATAALVGRRDLWAERRYG